jgi:predicted nucleic acid-binding Zn ribbon protein
VALRALISLRLAQPPPPHTTMPSYDYHCPANGRVIEVEHRMAESVTTWRALCARAGIPLGDTPGAAKVERLISGGNVIRAGSLGSRQERPCDTGPCGAPACGRGACGF